MKEKSVIIIIFAFTIIGIIGAVFFLSSSSTPATIAASQNTQASIDQNNFDWGKINMKDGNVSKTFLIKNTGIDTLKLTKVKTSCHCTKATLRINGTVSPSFGMNTTSSWVGEVPPGAQAELGIVFDPAYHGPNGVGPISRYISVDTNDPNNSTLEFTLTANVTK